MPQIAKIKMRFLWELGLYYGLSLLIALLYQQYGLFLGDSYQALIAFDALISLITLSFVARHWKSLRFLFFLRSVKVKELLVLVCLAVILGVLASSIADYLNELFYHRKQSLSFLFWETPYPKTFSVLFICLQPAIVEELSYRGLVIFYLKEGVNIQWIALVGSALLFSFMHLNLMGWIWLMPLGLLLAYFRLRYRSLWYGIFAHFCYNFVILWLEW